MLVWLNHRRLVFVVLLFLPTPPALACGPFFPNRMLIDGDNVVLSAPIVSFEQEIEYIRPPVPSRFKAIIPSAEDEYGHLSEDRHQTSLEGKPQRYFSPDRYRQQTAVKDMADLEQALSVLTLSDAQRNDILDRYCIIRQALLDYGVVLSRWKAQTEWERTTKRLVSDTHLTEAVPPPQFESPVIPRQLPAEFADYLRGAIFYYQRQPAKARQAWVSLLKRPRQQRLYRSTWVAFMIGKILLEEDPAGATKWFQLVRELAGEGFVDSLGLASSSLGWEARAALNTEDYGQAIELYVAQMATGDPTARASLSYTARKAFGMERRVLVQLAGNTTTRRVMTAISFSQRVSEEIRIFLARL